MSRSMTTAGRPTSKCCPDQTGATTAGFLRRTIALVCAPRRAASLRVLTDNGGNYRSQRFQAVAARASVRLKRARGPIGPKPMEKPNASSKR